MLALRASPRRLSHRICSPNERDLTTRWREVHRFADGNSSRMAPARSILAQDLSVLPSSSGSSEAKGDLRTFTQTLTRQIY